MADAPEQVLEPQSDHYTFTSDGCPLEQATKSWFHLHSCAGQSPETQRKQSQVRPPSPVGKEEKKPVLACFHGSLISTFQYELVQGTVQN